MLMHQHTQKSRFRIKKIIRERKQKLNKPKNQPGKMYLSQNTVNAIINYTPEGEKKKKKSQNL